MKNLRKQIQKLSTLALVMLSGAMHASGTGGSGASAAISQIEAWSSDIESIFNAAVAVFGIVGGFIIFVQYMQGNEQAQKNFIKFVIGLAIFGLISFIVSIFVP